MTQQSKQPQSTGCEHSNMNELYASQAQGQCYSRNSNSNLSEIGQQQVEGASNIGSLHVLNQQQLPHQQNRNRQQQISEQQKQKQISYSQIPDSFQQIPLNAYIQGKAQNITQPQSVASAEEYLQWRNQYVKCMQQQWALQQEQIHQQEQAQLQKYQKLDDMIQLDQIQDGCCEEAVRQLDNFEDVQKNQLLGCSEQEIMISPDRLTKEQEVNINIAAKDSSSNTSRNVRGNLHVWNFLNGVSTTQSQEADIQSTNSNNNNNTNNQQTTDPPTTYQTILQKYEKEIKFLKQLHFCIYEQLQNLSVQTGEEDKKRVFDIIFCCLRLVEEQQVGVVGLFESQIGDVVHQISKMDSSDGGVSAELARILEDKWIDTVDAWIHSDQFPEEIEFIVQRSQSGWLGLIEEWRQRKAELGVGVEIQDSEEGSNHAINYPGSPNNCKKQEEATPATVPASHITCQNSLEPQSPLQDRQLPWYQKLAIERMEGVSEQSEERSCNRSNLNQYEMEDVEIEADDSGNDEDYVASEFNEDTLDTLVETQEQSESETEVVTRSE